MILNDERDPGFLLPENVSAGPLHRNGVWGGIVAGRTTRLIQPPSIEDVGSEGTVTVIEEDALPRIMIGGVEVNIPILIQVADAKVKDKVGIDVVIHGNELSATHNGLTVCPNGTDFLKEDPSDHHGEEQDKADSDDDSQ